MFSQLTGAQAHRRLVEALLALPGVRLIDRDALVSVLPTVAPMSRGFGTFLLFRAPDRSVRFQVESQAARQERR